MGQWPAVVYSRTLLVKPLCRQHEHAKPPSKIAYAKNFFYTEELMLWQTSKLAWIRRIDKIATVWL